MVNPTRYILYLDTNGLALVTDSISSGSTYDVHSNFINFCFGDGHGEKFKEDPVIASDNHYARFTND